jgi:hypothetical protein
MSYQKNTIRLYIRLIVNSIRKEFIPTNTYIYIKITTTKLNKFYLQKILMLYRVKKVAIE